MQGWRYVSVRAFRGLHYLLSFAWLNTVCLACDDGCHLCVGFSCCLIRQLRTVNCQTNMLRCVRAVSDMRSSRGISSDAGLAPKPSSNTEQSMIASRLPMTSSQEGAKPSGIVSSQMKSTANLTATLFESHRWRLYETRQASRTRGQTVAELRKLEGG